MLLLECPRFTALNQSDLDKRNVLHHAAIWGDAEICKAVLARPEFKTTSYIKQDVFDKTALEYAEERGYDEAAQVLRTAISELPERPDGGDAEQESAFAKVGKAMESAMKAEVDDGIDESERNRISNATKVEIEDLASNDVKLSDLLKTFGWKDTQGWELEEFKDWLKTDLSNLLEQLRVTTATSEDPSRPVTTGTSEDPSRPVTTGTSE